MHFVVWRGSWHRGGLVKMNSPSRLLNKKNEMCCIGQAAYELGVQMNKLLDLPFSSAIKDGPEKLLRGANLIAVAGGGKIVSSQFVKDAAEINDKEYLTEEERESQLTAVFAKVGHTLEFKDGISPWFEAAHV